MGCGSEQGVNDTLRLLREHFIDPSTVREEGGRKVADIVVPKEYSSLALYVSSIFGVNSGTFNNHVSLLGRAGLIEKGAQGKRRRWLDLERTFRHADVRKKG